jgi:hypothetical protein
MRSALFWDLTQRRMVVGYRRFKTTYRYHLQGPNSPTRVLQISCNHSDIKKTYRFFCWEFLGRVRENLRDLDRDGDNIKPKFIHRSDYVKCVLTVEETVYRQLILFQENGIVSLRCKISVRFSDTASILFSLPRPDWL